MNEALTTLRVGVAAAVSENILLPSSDDWPVARVRRPKPGVLSPLSCICAIDD